MKAELIAIGAELTTGQSLDTNSSWLAGKLAALGVDVRHHTTVGDDLQECISAFRIACSRADLVVIGGGLGPTQDDLTREALAAAAGVELALDPKSLADLEAYFARRSRPMPERNRVQALLPHGAEPLENPIGSAPGVWMTIDRAHIAALPGVPRELKRMFDEQAGPRIIRLLGADSRVILTRKINLFGKGESDIEAQALDLTARGRAPEIGITASDATISFRIVAAGASAAEAQALLESSAQLIYDRFPDLIVGEGEDDVAEALVKELHLASATIATAESCTGGQVSDRLTAIAGVSAHFLGGVVSYANEAKIRLLGVPPEVIERRGAVSAETAAAMASGARALFGADLAISVTGIAGPGGGAAEKPVGLVYIGLADSSGVATERFEMGPEQPREFIRIRAAKHALNLARRSLRAKRLKM